jgi:hypothetical protein
MEVILHLLERSKGLRIIQREGLLQNLKILKVVSLLKFFFRKFILSKNVQGLRHCYLYPFVLSILDIQSYQGNNPDPLINYATGVFIISLVALFCFVNVVGILTTLYLISKYNTEIDKKFESFPRIRKIIKYYEGSSIFYLTIEILFCLVCILILLLSSAFIMGIPFFVQFS